MSALKSTITVGALLNEHFAPSNLVELSKFTNKLLPFGYYLINSYISLELFRGTEGKNFSYFSFNYKVYFYTLVDLLVVLSTTLGDVSKA